MAPSKHERWLGSDDGEDLAGRAVRAGSWAGAAQVGRALVEVASTVVLARLLLPEEFGLVGMVLAFTGFLVLFKDLGLSTATIQRDKITQVQVSSLLWLNLGAGVLLTLLGGALAPVLAWFYQDPRLVGVTLGMSGTFLLGAIGVQHAALLRRNLKFGRIATIDLTATLLGLAAAIGAAMMDFGYWALVIRALVSEAVTGVGPWIACSWRPGKGALTDEVKELVKFGGNLTGFGIVNYFARNLDDVLIGKLFGPAVLGFYQKAYEILMMPLRQINTPVGAVAVPALSRMDTASERYRRSYFRILEKLLLITSFLGGYLILTADWIVVAVLGETWAPTAPIFAWLGLLVFTQPVGNTTGWLFVTQDRTGDMLRWGIIGSALAMLSFVAGLPWGATGVAAAYAVSGVVIRTPVVLWMVTRAGPIRMSDFARVMAPYLFAAACVGGVVWGLRFGVGFDSPWIGLAVTAPTAVVVYGALMVMLPPCRRALADGIKLIRDARRPEDFT